MLGIILTNMLVGASLAVDAFAVTIADGLANPQNRLKNTFIQAGYFGFFQFLMPVLGFLLAGTVSDKIMTLGPYISFFMLALVGGKMLYESIRGTSEEDRSTEDENGRFSHSKTLVLAIATSIDALAIGVSFAFTQSSILFPCVIIGVTTFVICVLGGLLCSKLPKSSGKSAGIIGGIVLIAIGIKLLVEGII